MKVQLNLATSPFLIHRRFFLGAGLLGIVSIGAFMVLSYRTVQTLRDSRSLRSEIGRYNSDIREFKRQRRDLEDYFNDPATKKSLERAAFFNGLIDQRSFPWTQVFTVLERILPSGVRIASIAPKMENGRVEVRLLVGALSDESAIEFLRKLYASPEFANIRVMSQAHPNRNDQPDKVVLELAAIYHSTEVSEEEGAPSRKSD